MANGYSDQEPSVARVSVVIPCYCCKSTIRRALESVYLQSLRPAEVILIDDSSPDDTLSFLYELAAEYSKGWIKVGSLAVNSGPGTARNKGWDMATQRYVAFLDSDDSWHHNKIELQYDWMERNPEAVLTGQKGLMIDVASSEVRTLYGHGDVKFTEVIKKRLLISNHFSTPSIMLRRELTFRFPESKRFCEDYELWCELCCSGLKCYSMDQPLTFCHKPLYGAAGLSSHLWKMEKGELGVYSAMREKRKIGRVHSCALKAWSLVRYVRRALKIRYSSGPQ
ncbi:glycosyltransferase [Pseudomonas sp. 15FMM2]|uniref:Glycosyltransferase n=1 Tax=Pseudomonas imrae TaxID=2992837 RepID=A0ACC7PBD8_9PSED